MRSIKRTVIAAAVLILLAGAALAAPLYNIETEIIQPNGERLTVFASGDEYSNYLHSENGSLLIRDEETGYYCFAMVRGDTITAGSVIVTAENLDSFRGVTAGAAADILAATAEERMAVKEALARENAKEEPCGPSPEPSSEPLSGELNAIMVFALFESDTGTFSQNYGKVWDVYNATDKASVFSYFNYESGGSFELSTTILPPAQASETVKWITLDYDRNYFMPYNASTNPIGYRTTNENYARSRELCKAVYEEAAKLDLFPGDVDYDRDNDGYIDSFNVIILGPAGEWNSPLWPHSYSSSSNVKVNGLRLYSYTLDVLDSNGTHDPNTAIHELSHTLGMPDLYHYSSGGDPVGDWDIMCNSHLSTPQLHTAYMRSRYMGWCDIPKITSSGTYTLSPSSQNLNNAYIIDLDEHDEEYFIVEYRRAEGMFDAALPGSGLIVYRVNDSIDGNSDGPPDMLYVFRKDSVNSAYLSAGSGRTEMGYDFDSFFSYSNNIVSKLGISNVGMAGDTITFDVRLKSSFNLEIREINRSGRTITFAIPEDVKKPVLQTYKDGAWTSAGGTAGTGTITCPAPISDGVYLYRVESAGSAKYDKLSHVYALTVREGHIVMFEDSFEEGNSNWTVSNYSASAWTFETSLATDGSAIMYMSGGSSTFTVSSPELFIPGIADISFDAMGNYINAELYSDGELTGEEALHLTYGELDSFAFQLLYGGKLQLAFEVTSSNAWGYIDNVVITTPLLPSILGPLDPSGDTFVGSILSASGGANIIGELKLRWYLDGIYYCESPTLTLTEEMLGRKISVSATNAACFGSLTYEWEQPVRKSEQPAPEAPVILRRSPTAVELEAVTGAEYSVNGGRTWQASPVFEGLTPNTGYAFICRMAETGSASASPVSAGTMVTTLPGGSGIIVTKNADGSGARAEIWGQGEHTMVCAVYDGAKMVRVRVVTAADSTKWSRVIDFDLPNNAAEPVIILYRMGSGELTLIQPGIIAT